MLIWLICKQTCEKSEDIPLTFIFIFKELAAKIVATTQAAPPISALILSIFDDGFKDMPPLK